MGEMESLGHSANYMCTEKFLTAIFVYLVKLLKIITADVETVFAHVKREEVV